jgi:hypothetical protein
VQRVGLAGFFMLAACAKDGKPAPAAASADGWQCFARDPAEPDQPQGNVAFIRQRVIQGRIESDSVFVQSGAGGATRLVLTPNGDHLEATLKGQLVTARLLVADGSHWILSYKDDAHGLSFDEDSVIAGGILTVTSMDGGAKTAVKFIPASCDVVVAELAKYP